MDPLIEELYGSLHRIKFNDQMGSIISSHNDNFGNMGKRQDFSSNSNPSVANPSQFIPPNSNLDLEVPSLGHHQVQALEVERQRALHDEFDFGDDDVVLKYINLLMEEDGGEKTHLSHEPSALEAKEKSFFDVLGDLNPPSLEPYNLPIPNYHNWNNYENISGNCFDSCTSSNSYGFNATPSQPPSMMSYSSSGNSGRTVSASYISFDTSVSSSGNALGSVDGPGPGPAVSPVSALSVSDIFNDSQSILQFHKGLEEASKFLPKGSLYEDLRPTRPKLGPVNSKNNISGKKHRYAEETQSEEPGNKQSAVNKVSDEAIMRSEMFDRVLLCSKGKNDAVLRESLQNELTKNVQNSQAKVVSGGRGRGRKQGGKRDVVDLRSLLSLCAQAVASNDQRSANDLLKQIRLHCSQNGDGNQRMAFYFANGLEARLAGVGTSIYKGLLTGPGTAVDFLRAYHMFLAMCPFKKIGNFYSNRSISMATEKATRIHIIDIGIVYGFQWPCLFQRISSRPEGPPKIRITGIDLPQPGFRPGKRLEETGNRLKNYAESFKIPFEFQAIAKKWETVTVEDLNIDEDELLIVNCLFRFKYIPEETAMVECPRDMVLNLIKKIKPAIFIQGAVNGAFNSPFFITRFREALFHFSTLFDMLEVNLPRDAKERMLIERDIFGRQAMNVIACEGLERIERPETYKQWQVRIERAGFKQLVLKQEITDMAKKRVKAVYHKDFSIDEDGRWLLMGWKGRIVYVLTTWVLS